MSIHFRLPPNVLTPEERRFISTQIRFATRYHDHPLAGVRIELVPEIGNRRARVTAIEKGGGPVVTEREAHTAVEAICEAISVLDRALHGAAMARRDTAPDAWAA